MSIVLNGGRKDEFLESLRALHPTIPLAPRLKVALRRVRKRTQIADNRVVDPPVIPKQPSKLPFTYPDFGMKPVTAPGPCHLPGELRKRFNHR